MLWIKVAILSLLLFPVRPERLQLGPTIEEQQGRLITVSNEAPATMDCIATDSRTEEIKMTLTAEKQGIERTTTIKSSLEGSNCAGMELPNPQVPVAPGMQSSLSSLRY